MSAERIVRQEFTEQMRIEFVLSNGHKITIKSVPTNTNYHNAGSRREWVARQEWEQSGKAREFGLTISTLSAFTDTTRVETVERTYLKTVLTETREPK